MAFCCEAATQAKWHNKRNVPIYASVECCPPLRGRRGFPFKGERRGGKHLRKGEIAIKVIGESPNGRGNVAIKVTPLYTLVEDEKALRNFYH